MEATNTQLEKELEASEFQKSTKFRKLKLKEKNDKYENDQKKRNTFNSNFKCKKDRIIKILF